MAAVVASEREATLLACESRSLRCAINEKSARGRSRRRTCVLFPRPLGRWDVSYGRTRAIVSMGCTIFGLHAMSPIAPIEHPD